MKLIKNGEVCMLRNFLTLVIDARMLPSDLVDTADDMLRIVEDIQNAEDINTACDNSKPAKVVTNGGW